MTRSPSQAPSAAEIFLLGAAGLLGFLGLWWGLSASGLVAKQFLPTPFEVLARTLYLLTEPFAGATLPEHLARSFERLLWLSSGCGRVRSGLLMDGSAGSTT